MVPRAVDPPGISCGHARHHFEMPRGAGNVRIRGQKAGVFLQKLNCNAWPCRVIRSGDIATIGEAKPAAYQSRLIVMRESTRLDIQRKIRPGRKTVLARDAGLRVV